AAVVVVTTDGFKHRLEQRGVTAEVVRSGVSPAELAGASGLTATGAIPLISPVEESTRRRASWTRGRAQPALRGHSGTLPGSEHLHPSLGQNRGRAPAHRRRRRRCG